MPGTPTVVTVEKELFGFLAHMSVPDGTVYVTLERRANGVIRAVEGADSITVPDKLATEFDVEDFSALQNTVVEYRAVSLWTDGATSEIIKGDWVLMDTDYLNFGGDVLFHAARPDLRMKVTVASIGAVSRDTPQEIVYGMDRADPIVVSGRTRYPTGQVTLYTFSDEDRRQLLFLVRNTDILAFSPWKPNYGYDIVPYLAVGKTVEERPSPRGNEPTRKWTLDFQQVEPAVPEEKIGSSPTPVPPPGNEKPPSQPDPEPDPEGTILWNAYLDSRWRDAGTMTWGEVAGIDAGG